MLHLAVIITTRIKGVYDAVTDGENTKNMKLRGQTIGLIVWIFTLTAACLCGAERAANETSTDTPLQWMPLNMARIREDILENQSLTDEQQVVALTYELDKRITLAPLAPDPSDLVQFNTRSDRRQMTPGSDYGKLISFIAEGYRIVKEGGPYARPEAVAATLAKLNTLPNIQNRNTVRSLLYVALSEAGGDAPRDELLRLLKQPDTHQEVIYHLLSGMLLSKRPEVQYLPRVTPLPFDLPSRVPRRALPRLLQLAEHPWSYAIPEPAGPGFDRRIYPIREMAYACLLELGVTAEKQVVPKDSLNEDEDPQITETIIKVDHASAEKVLQQLK